MSIVKSVLQLCFISSLYPSLATSTTATVEVAPLKGELFKEFEELYTRKYDSTTEREKRFNIFVTNLDKIEKLSARDKHATYSHLTQWADMTEDEFSRMHGLGEEPNTICQFEEEPPRLSPQASPQDSVDWVAAGATVEVKNQGKCGSCWAHTTTAVVESRLKIDTDQIVSLSEQYLLDCDASRVCGGCCGGLAERSLQWLANPATPGIASEVDYPYTSASGDDPTEGQCQPIPMVAKVEGFGVVNGDGHSMMAASTEYGVLAVAMDAKPLQFYTEGIIRDPECGTIANHAVSIVGYGTDQNGIKFWKVRNSYGPEFGESGYFRIERNDAGGPCGLSGCVVAATGASHGPRQAQEKNPFSETV